MKIEESHGIVFLVYTNVPNVDFKNLFLKLKLLEDKVLVRITDCKSVLS